ncbi:hypothetical protein AT6N2_C2375 [Agrobacterium tumefaciens]|nr:hypothetical protein AT6N2_C2375 [Agrobacterium tumefaciens]
MTDIETSASKAAWLPCCIRRCRAATECPLSGHQRWREKMRQVAKTSRHFFGETFAVLGAALSVSAAVRAHRKPARADLEALGIDGKAFDKVQL